MANKFEEQMAEHDRLYAKAAALNDYDLSEFVAVSDFPITLWSIYFIDPATDKRSTGYAVSSFCLDRLPFTVYDTDFSPGKRRVLLLNNTDSIAFERIDIDTPAGIPFHWLEDIEVDLEGTEWYNAPHPTGGFWRFLRSVPNHTARVTVGQRVPQWAMDILIEAARMSRHDD